MATHSDMESTALPTLASGEAVAVGLLAVMGAPARY
jgi:hypothetical protein